MTSAYRIAANLRGRGLLAIGAPSPGKNDFNLTEGSMRLRASGGPWGHERAHIPEEVPDDYAAFGLMFWFKWNRLVGSYLVLIATRRS